MGFWGLTVSRVSRIYGRFPACATLGSAEFDDCCDTSGRFYYMKSCRNALIITFLSIASIIVAIISICAIIKDMILQMHSEHTLRTRLVLNLASKNTPPQTLKPRNIPNPTKLKPESLEATTPSLLGGSNGRMKVNKMKGMWIT